MSIARYDGGWQRRARGAKHPSHHKEGIVNPRDLGIELRRDAFALQECLNLCSKLGVYGDLEILVL